MNLHGKKCVPCEGGVRPLVGGELEEYIGHVDNWLLQEENTAIRKEFKFKNYVKALEFVNKISEIAEQQKHHPDIEFGWGYCNVTLSTHAICGLHENDFILAANIDRIANA